MINKKKLIVLALWNFLFIFAAVVTNTFMEGEVQQLSAAFIRGYFILTLLALLIIGTLKEQLLKN